VVARSGANDVSDSNTGQKGHFRIKALADKQKMWATTAPARQHTNCRCTLHSPEGRIVEQHTRTREFWTSLCEKGAVHNANTCSGQKEAGKGKQGQMKPGNKDNQA